ncbi:DUF3370 family protein [Microcoleus sp. herbarium14]|uniref:DUF3370 family protein n=1 Tax=Microcoleus sp. herbarium14 TaxID=3055439 RepID=UPI002FD02E0F
MVAAGVLVNRVALPGAAEDAEERDCKNQQLRSIKVDFIYPPDATPPQVLRVRTLE